MRDPFADRRAWQRDVMPDLVAALIREAPLPEQLGPEWYRVHREHPGYWPMWWRDTGETRLYSPPLHPDPRKWSSARSYPVEVREVLLQVPRIVHRGEELPRGLLHPAQAADAIVAFELPHGWIASLQLLRDDPGPGNAMLVWPRYGGSCGPAGDF